jgi:hypothetical protein
MYKGICNGRKTNSKDGLMNGNKMALQIVNKVKRKCDGNRYDRHIKKIDEIIRHKQRKGRIKV